MFKAVRIYFLTAFFYFYTCAIVRTGNDAEPPKRKKTMTAANDIFANFATDEKAELEGRVVPYTADSSFVVARAGNKNYNRLLSNLWKRNKVALDAKGDAAEALSDRLLVEIIAKTILLGWTNIKFQGKELPYSVENAQKLLSIKDFRKYIVELSNDFEAFKQEEEAEEEKN